MNFPSLVVCPPLIPRCSVIVLRMMSDPQPPSWQGVVVQSWTKFWATGSLWVGRREVRTTSGVGGDSRTVSCSRGLPRMFEIQSSQTPAGRFPAGSSPKRKHRPRAFNSSVRLRRVFLSPRCSVYQIPATPKSPKDSRVLKYRTDPRQPFLKPHTKTYRLYLSIGDVRSVNIQKDGCEKDATDMV